MTQMISDLKDADVGSFLLEWKETTLRGWYRIFKMRMAAPLSDRDYMLVKQVRMVKT